MKVLNSNSYYESDSMLFVFILLCKLAKRISSLILHLK